MKKQWFEEGLRFSCRRCGTCCTGEPGYVFLKQGEEQDMASLLGMDVAAFRQKYVRRVGERTSLREEKDGRCIFFADRGCRVYSCRPVQCLSFPFWMVILARRETWEEMAGECPGMNRGRLFSRREIEGLCRARAGKAT